MSDLFDFEKVPDNYAVMGNPIGHSKSPQIHSAFAKQTRQHVIYQAMLVDVGGFAQAVGNFHANGGKGLSITVPFKLEAFRLADELSSRAESAGAVNTLMFRDDNTVLGDNTDGVGLLRDLQNNHHIDLEKKSILLLGAGGAARGVIEPLLSAQPAQLVIANRTVDKALTLAASFNSQGKISACGYHELPGQTFDIIINATSASLHGNLPPLPDGILEKHGCCYDMMYAKELTPFLMWAKGQGANKLMDGLGMLVEQAAEAFELWRGVRPETTQVIEDLRQEMG